jgi:hypothetical protein
MVRFKTGVNAICNNRNRNCLQLWKTITDSPVTIGYSLVWFVVILRSYGPDLKALVVASHGSREFE